MSEQQSTPRRPWVAALLSLLGGPLGQLYCGRGVRFFVLAFITLLLFPLLSALAVSPSDGRVAFVVLMIAAVCYPILLIVDAVRIARSTVTTQLKWFQRWWIYPLVFVVYLTAIEGVSRFTRTYVAESFVVPSRPMSPTIMAGDRIFVTKMAGGSDAIDYGDVVVFHSRGPGSPLYVMRVIALGGDTIEIVDEKVILNGVAISDPNANFEGELPEFEDLANMATTSVPRDCFFVLGDSRRRSMDSRFLGPISKTDYRGTAVRVFWSRPRTIKDPRNLDDVNVGPVAWERIGMMIR
ncbi:signal peptidase I [Planctomycetes bacterium CA13]